MSKKIKIGLLLEAHPSGGGEFQYNQVVLDAVASLPRGKFKVVIIFTYDGWKEKLNDYNLPAKKVKLGFCGRAFGKVWRSIDLPLRGWRRICHLVHPVAKELIRQNCNLWVFPSASMWSYQSPVPALVTIYDLMHRYEKRFPEVSVNGVYEHREKHYKQMCWWARGILVDSEVGRQQVVESYGTDSQKVHVLPYIPPRYIYNKDIPNGFERRYRLPPQFIFYPAQFWEHKNHSGLVQAVNILRTKYPDLNLVFVGAKKNGYKSTQDMVQELDLTKNIMFLGYVPDNDMPELYRRARGMVMPTFFGPTNIPPLEANALGCPVAVSNIYGMPEQLGDAAIYFDPTSVEEIAHAIEEIWTNDNLCCELRIRGLKRDAQWNQSHFNKKFYAIIENVLNQT